MTVIVIDIIIIILYHHHHQCDDDDNDGLLFRALGQGAFGEVYQGLFKKSQNGEVRKLGHPLEKLDFLREKKHKNVQELLSELIIIMVMYGKYMMVVVEHSDRFGQGDQFPPLPCWASSHQF